MLVVGLTGSIAMGKTVTAGMLRGLGVPVHDADATVHYLLAPGGAAVRQVAQSFPEVLTPEGGIDRARLGGLVFSDTAALRRLEAVLHPMVRAAERQFLRSQAARHAPLVVLDIPLLFETGGAGRCDAVIVVSAPAFLQRSRALRRHGMTLEKLAAIEARQVPDRIKRRLTPYVVQTGIGRRPALRQLIGHLQAIRQQDRRIGVDRRRAARRYAGNPMITRGRA